MYLFNNPILFQTIINEVDNRYKYGKAFIEKDYYLSLILYEISKLNEDIVFKGGTSLSKAYHAIERFSEDVDLSFPYHIGEARRKKLKYNVMKAVSEKTGISITNFQKTESDKDLNEYIFPYNTVLDSTNNIKTFIKVETALMFDSFPIERKTIQSFIGEYISNNSDGGFLETYPELKPFTMNVQTIERTFIDKYFAICDCYLQKRSNRISRHLYDLYMLENKIKYNDEFKSIFNRLKIIRANNELCPSSKEGINLFDLVNTIIQTHYYKDDYQKVTKEFIYGKTPSYDDVCKSILRINERINKL